MKSVTSRFRPGLLKATLLVVVAIGIGFGGGYVVKMLQDRAVLSATANSFAPIQQKESGYALVQPLLGYRSPEATVFGDYVGLNASFESLIHTATASGSVARVGVYFRDLNAGKWVGVNENDTYYPASLLKVPVMFAYGKEAEEDPSILDQNIVYNPAVMPAEEFEATSTLVTGHSYSVSSLISHMITDSDNGATFTLIDNLNPDFLNTVYTALGIQDPGDDSADYQISARTYGLFFRILYNATYLSPETSEKDLETLSQATFTNGLVAGVPAGTVVAHKFGEHVLSQGNVATGVELSDCGIVYYPSHPYLLCVMTSASDLTSAQNIIANISSASYSAVVNEYGTTTTK